MLLSQILSKSIELRDKTCATAIAIGVSSKNFTIKYIFCGNIENTAPQFVLNYSALQTITPISLRFAPTRPVIPKSCFILVLQKSVYSQKGEFIGFLENANIENGVLTQLFIDKNVYSPSEIFAVSDVIILKKSSPFPLGQRIPAPHEYPFCTEKDTLVNKRILRGALENGKIIKLTLSLSPFSSFTTL